MLPDRATVVSWLRGGQAGIEKWHRFLTEQESSPLDKSIAPASGSIVPQVDLSGVDLNGVDLSNVRLWRAWFNEAKFRGAKLDGASFGDASLRGADFSNASLRGASLGGADLMNAKFCDADLTEVFLQRASCLRTDFSGAIIERADLTMTSLVDVNLERANVSGCFIYGLSAWGLALSNAVQTDLVITHPNDSAVVTVDSLEVAQFVHLLLRNEHIRRVIDTITSKVVLILGRFTPERKAVLDAVREALRKHDLCPVMFDFDKPESRGFVETVSTLAHMARFVIADFSDPKVVLQEVAHIVYSLAVPIVPLMHQDAGAEPVTLADVRRGRTFVLDTHRYKSIPDLIASLGGLIGAANAIAQDLRS